MFNKKGIQYKCTKITQQNYLSLVSFVIYSILPLDRCAVQKLALGVCHSVAKTLERFFAMCHK